MAPSPVETSSKASPMSAQAETLSRPRGSGVLTAILIGGTVAGVIDLGAASLISGHDPMFISRFVAGGLAGKPALDGGMTTAALGLGLQVAMSILIAAIYALAVRIVPFLRRHWILGGLIGGAVTFAMMNYVVLPMSAWHRVPHFTAVSAAENGAAMLLFGLIIAFFARKSGAPKEAG
jgi:hypothetical protein